MLAARAVDGGLGGVERVGGGQHLVRHVGERNAAHLCGGGQQRRVGRVAAGGKGARLHQLNRPGRHFARADAGDDLVALRGGIGFNLGDALGLRRGQIVLPDAVGRQGHAACREPFAVRAPGGIAIDGRNARAGLEVEDAALGDDLVARGHQ